MGTHSTRYPAEVRERAVRPGPRNTLLRRRICATEFLQKQMLAPAVASDRALYAEPRNSLRKRIQSPSTGLRTPDGPRSRTWA